MCEVLRTLYQNKLFAKLSKREFHKKEMDFLGYRISGEMLKMDPEKMRDVLKWAPPTNRWQLQLFIGFANFYQRFIPNLAKVALPLTDLLKNKGKNLEKVKPRAKLNWTRVSESI